MRIAALVTLLAAGLLVAWPSPAKAAPAPGKLCASKGQTVTVGWTQLACRKTAKGLRWKVIAKGPVYEVTELGELLSCAADPTAVLLDPARARVYFAGSNEGPCRTEAGQEGPDSLVVPVPAGAVVLDAGRRFDVFGFAGPHKRVVRLPDGRYRMFFSTKVNSEPVGIGSAISADGLTFTVEPGLRISLADADVGSRPALSTGDVVRTKDGRYRMYFSSFAFAPRHPENDKEVVKSAVSSDLLTWTVESGDRVGGTARLSGSAEHPAAIRQPDGSVTLFYGRPFREYGLYYSWSPDGLTFTREVLLLPRVLDSAFVRMADGTVAGFVGRRDDAAERSYIDRVTLTPR